MPKLFEYVGIVVLFYSNKHLPVHDHGKDQGRESRAELVVENGRVVDVVLGTVRGRRPLDGDQLKDFEAVVRHSGDDIVRNWVDYFVLHRPVSPRVITRRIR